MRSRRLTVCVALLAVIGALLVVPGTGDPQTRPLPPGHPPTGDSGAHPSIPAPPPGSGADGQGLHWKSPAGWTEEAPSSSMRRAQYRISGDRKSTRLNSSHVEI